jgi:hypothetical protein
MARSIHLTVLSGALVFLGALNSVGQSVLAICPPAFASDSQSPDGAAEMADQLRSEAAMDGNPDQGDRSPAPAETASSTDAEQQSTPEQAASEAPADKDNAEQTDAARSDSQTAGEQSPAQPSSDAAASNDDKDGEAKTESAPADASAMSGAASDNSEPNQANADDTAKNDSDRMTDKEDSDEKRADQMDEDKASADDSDEDSVGTDDPAEENVGNRDSEDSEAKAADESDSSGDKSMDTKDADNADANAMKDESKETANPGSNDTTSDSDSASGKDEERVEHSLLDALNPIYRYYKYNQYQPAFGSEYMQGKANDSSASQAAHEPERAAETTPSEPKKLEAIDTLPAIEGETDAEQSDSESSSQLEAAVETPAPGETLEKFAATPRGLLLPDDQQILKTLYSQRDASADMRRETVENYLGQMGYDAEAFSRQLHESMGIEPADLADDLPRIAALLACFRPVERGQLTAEEGVDLLRRSLENLSSDWTTGVQSLAANQPDQPHAKPAVELTDVEPAVASVVPVAWQSLRAAITGQWESVRQSLDQLADRLSQAEWLAKLADRSDRQASHAATATSR